MRKRASKTDRTQDGRAVLEQRIKEYHRQFDAIGAYFPNANIQKVDATKSIDKVSKQVDAMLQAAGVQPKAQ